MYLKKQIFFLRKSFRTHSLYESTFKSFFVKTREILKNPNDNQIRIFGNFCLIIHYSEIRDDTFIKILDDTAIVDILKISTSYRISTNRLIRTDYRPITFVVKNNID